MSRGGLIDHTSSGSLWMWILYTTWFEKREGDNGTDEDDISNTSVFGSKGEEKVTIFTNEDPSLCM